MKWHQFLERIIHPLQQLKTLMNIGLCLLIPDTAHYLFQYLCFNGGLFPAVGTSSYVPNPDNGPNGPNIIEENNG
jgi:hypothetical protein